MDIPDLMMVCVTKSLNNKLGICIKDKWADALLFIYYTSASGTLLTCDSVWSVWKRFMAIPTPRPPITQISTMLTLWYVIINNMGTTLSFSSPVCKAQEWAVTVPLWAEQWTSYVILGAHSQEATGSQCCYTATLNAHRTRSPTREVKCYSSQACKALKGNPANCVAFCAFCTVFKYHYLAETQLNERQWSRTCVC